MTDLLTRIDEVTEAFVAQSVAPAADRVDRTAEVPKETLQAFLASGLAGLLASKESGVPVVAFARQRTLFLEGGQASLKTLLDEPEFALSSRPAVSPRTKSAAASLA